MLILVRHGESAWNASDRFAGWEDVPLTSRGRQEATAAGGWLIAEGITPTHVYSSVLRRAGDTAERILAGGGIRLPVVRAQVLNERHYGALQGMTRSAAVEKYGAERVARWRRTVDACPPPDAEGRGESLADVRRRVAPFVREVLDPGVTAGRTILVVSHGNTLRMLVQLLEGLSDDDACALELPTGQPRVCADPARLGPDPD